MLPRSILFRLVDSACRAPMHNAGTAPFPSLIGARQGTVTTLSRGYAQDRGRRQQFQLRNVDHRTVRELQPVLPVVPGLADAEWPKLPRPLEVLGITFVQRRPRTGS